MQKAECLLVLLDFNGFSGFITKRNRKYYLLRFVLRFLDITRTEPIGFGPDLVGILPMSLQQLSKELRDQNHNKKHEQTEN